MSAAFFGNDAHLKMIIEQCDRTLPIITSKPVTIINTCVICMIERLHAGVLCINPLFSHYLGESRIQFGLGILLRALHLDYLIMLNVLEIINRNRTNGESGMKELEWYCHTMLSDGAKHTLHLFKHADVPDLVRQRLYSDLVKRNPECFKPYANNGTMPELLITDTLSPKQIINKLKSSSMPWLAAKDHAYQFYSKYDHFTKLFSTISAQDFTREFIHLAEAIRELPRSFGIMLTLALLSTGDQSLTEITKVVGKHTASIDAQEKKEKEEAKSFNPFA